ncbi:MULTISPECIES: hypothetical protein [Paenibacillus]|uniref:hypothetical protein n=1 Tax=Paenibacillus TaxID=44249 RepID=UPI0022B8B3EE|nr:hypothetical protein [Paenibacillus caseinilyticus]MCZ8520262.1 hypothetical protein [Paenibacillus caseinilyticus]
MSHPPCPAPAPLRPPAGSKVQQILDPSTPLCKDDIVWMLEYIKKKVAEEDPNLMDLPQPRLMQNFRYFAEIALMVIQRRNGFDQEADRLKAWVSEAAYGLCPPEEPTMHRR